MKKILLGDFTMFGTKIKEHVKEFLVYESFNDFEKLEILKKKTTNYKSAVFVDLDTVNQNVIKNIRLNMPEIFLVGFITDIYSDTVEEQFLDALETMKDIKCNLIFSKSEGLSSYITVTAEETYYGTGLSEEESEKELLDIILARLDGEYTRTDFHQEKELGKYIDQTSENFRTVLQWVIDNKGFICNNGNEFTSGHFCQKINKNTFISSQRKADHRKVFTEGMTKIIVNNPSGNNDVFSAYGTRKPSVGARSQWIILNEFPEYDCIIHTHNPLKEGSMLPVRPQKFNQCGSIQCANTSLEGIRESLDEVKSVYLEKHGAIFLFKSSSNPVDVIKQINNNIILGVKTT